MTAHNALELVPGESLGYFKIGMFLSACLALIRANSREIKTANIKYSEEDIKQDIIVEIRDCGYSLHFDYLYQRMTKIVIFNVHLISLSYQKKPFCAPAINPTYQRIDQTFGPTCDEFRVSDNEPVSFVHLYESGGISFCFTVPSDLLEDYPGDIVNGAVINELPPRWAKLEVNSILIADPSHFCGNDPGKPLRSVTPEARVVEGVVGHGIRVCNVVNQNERHLIAELNFYSTPQEVLSQLGPPNRVNYKEDDKMRLHHGGTRDTSVDYFYNYFDLGFDILFDGIAHVIRKFILHTNHPSHFNFNRYTKCNFEIVFPDSYQTEAGNPVQRARSKHGNNVMRSAVANDDFDNVDQFKITAETKWEQVLAFLGPSSAKPFMSNREEVNLGGRTKFYGYPNLAIETMKNGYIASICLFSV